MATHTVKKINVNDPSGIVYLVPMTTAAILALAGAADGWIRYSSDLPGFFGHTNGAWYPIPQNG